MPGTQSVLSGQLMVSARHVGQRALARAEAVADGFAEDLPELSQLLLCDLTLHFNHPVKTDDLQEPEGKTPLFEESKISDVSFASTSFSI
ncbi:putative uncharacterized protein C5orf58 homolog [Leptonychotes weddellii]|uniref:Uncharacterized protein n=1 Tax=Leptonychotes weddellii TaxID=9713 RepID=A0A7F8PZ74_LEPWE|nr:putative uncharacterized protein C5orf58 homolog [Leptonychotes weddellii]